VTKVNLFSQRSYRSVIEIHLKDASGNRQRGAVKQLSEAVNCHSTFISHVLSNKAEFSTEQALRFCKYSSFDEEETDYFMDLVNKDKAGDTDTKKYYEEKLAKKKEEHLNLKNRLKVAETLTPDQQSIYYRSWLPQAVHLHCHLPGKHTIASLATSLGSTEQQIRSTTSDLVDLGFIEESDNCFVLKNNLVHLGKDSPIIAKSHYNWRIKTTQELMSRSSTKDSHYTSVFTASEATAQKIRELIINHIEETRELIIPSPSEKLYVFCLDFYGLTP